VSSVNKSDVEKPEGKKTIIRVFIFPACVVVCYGILSVIEPHKALMALKTSANLFLTVTLPLVLVFLIMLALHLFVTPSQIIRLFSSMGPIYAWYPLLKKLREEGAGTGPIAIFLYSRAIKPFLLPVMITYFGWVYVGILTALTVFASIAIGSCMSVLMKK